MAAVNIGLLVFETLAKLAPKLYDYVKSLIDGGADAAELAAKPVEVFVSFGGGDGKAITIQQDIESNMLDPDAE